MKILIDSGAHVNSGNEWMLRPLSVSILKGHKGIANYLITLPGVDVNVRDDQGRTILLNMLVDHGERITEAKINDIKNFVELHSADPYAVDNKGWNVLHYMTSYKVARFPLEEQAQLNGRVLKLVNFFLEKGVQTNSTNNIGQLPIQCALINKTSVESENRQEIDKRPDFNLIRKLLEVMVENAGPMPKASQVARDLVLAFFTSISPLFITEYSDLFHVLMDFVSKLQEKNEDMSKGFMDESFLLSSCIGKSTKRKTTVFAECCRMYACQNMEALRQRLEQKSKIGVKETVTIFLSMLETFILKFNPRLELTSLTCQRFSALHMLARASDNFSGFHMILNLKPNIFMTDDDNRDALDIIIEQEYATGVEALISAGSNVNRIRIYQSNNTKHLVKDCPLLTAIETGNLEIVSILLSAGASLNTQSMTGKSALHASVRRYSKERSKTNLHIVTLLLDKGANVNEADSKGRTPLHIAVKSGTANPDISLDLEVLLMRRGASLVIPDDLGRIPLHYSFVKSDLHIENRSHDPIQIVKALVENMDTSSVDMRDGFGCSALHYASYRGATICSLLLLQNGTDIEARNQMDQTPLALAVLAKHDSCSLMLIQHGANVNINMRTSDWILSEKDKLKPVLLRFLPQHFEICGQVEQSLFQGIVLNNWFGLTYVVLSKLEAFGFPLAQAIEVTFQLKKFHFGKTLLGLQVSYEKLQHVNSQGQNLVHTLALESSVLNEHDIFEDLIVLLVNTGKLDCSNVDNFGCTPLHYACLNKNMILVKFLLQDSNVNVNILDNHGRSALAACFWIYEEGKLSLELVELLIKHGADTSVCFSSPPISFLNNGYELKYRRSSFTSPVFNAAKVTPLMVALCHKDEAMVKLLIGHNSKATILDSLGNPTLIYAFKSNDEAFVRKMIILLKANKNTFDSEETGQLLKHVIALEPTNDSSLSYDNVNILKRLVETVINLSKVDGRSAILDLATRLGAHKVGAYLSMQFKIPFSWKLLLPPKLEAKENQPVLGHFDCQQDAAKMMNLLEQDLEQEIRSQGERKWSQAGCTVTDGHIHDDYNILLNKVDVGFGAFGLYNFYRIQIWKESNKQLWVLFTNWGRIESWGQGQFQNTPYSTADEAEKEFRKIFQSKTGNEWDCRKSFQNKPKKYRIVLAEHATKVVRPAVKFIWATKQKPSLLLSQLVILKDLTDVKMLRAAYASEAPIDTSAVPFGRIKKSALLKAQSLLEEEMLPLIKKREALDVEKFNTDSEVTSQPNRIFDELSYVLTELCRLSSEFHYLVPQQGLDFERVQPVDSLTRYTQEKLNLERLMDFEFTESLILGAMLRRKTIHPLSYVYQALDCRIEALEESSLEAQLVMKYMYQSRGAVNLRIEAVYRIQRADEIMRFQGAKPKYRKLLWHGTKRSHLLRNVIMGNCFPFLPEVLVYNVTISTKMYFESECHLLM